MNVILDFDYTLFDAGRFKEALADIFLSCGISKDRFRETYRQTVNRNSPQYDYDVSCHISLVSSESSCPAGEMQKKIDILLNDSEEYLYDGARDFVLQLRQETNQLILMTLGNERWQQEKIMASRLHRLFDRVIFVSSNKAVALQELDLDDSPTVVINDNGGEVETMQKACPNYHYIIKRGPKGANPNLGLPILDDFGEILENVQMIKS